jgi:hypothetical protein
MFTLAGTAEGDADGIALMWQDKAGAGGPGVAVTKVPVAIEFPAKFRVAVPVPPPAEARFVVAGGEPELGEAYVYVVGDLASAPAQRSVPMGVDRAHVVVWAGADVAEGTATADYLGGPVSAGYHLRRFASGQPGTAQRAVIERCVISIGGSAAREACAVRHGYQLGPSADDEALRIVAR